MSKKRLMCPVCGYEGLKESPVSRQNTPSYEICSCCGFEFGFDHDPFIAFRRRWIENGAPWFMPNLKPENWELEKQLANLNRKKSA